MQPFHRLFPRAALANAALRACWYAGKLEHAERSLGATLALIRQDRTLRFARDWSFAELLEWAARQYGTSTFLEYGAERYSFAELNARANQLARALQAAGLGAGSGCALMLDNHPRFITSFFAIQKLGAYAVPVNAALVGDGLEFILSDSEASFLICDHASASAVAAVRQRLPRLRAIWVNAAEAPGGYVLPAGFLNFNALESAAASGSDLGLRPDPHAPSLLLYTSGTTGLPKAVVNRHGQLRLKSLGLLAHLLYDRTDKLYTCLPLFHANALLLSVVQALWVGIPLYLSQRFSASRFWAEVAASGATQLNTVGGMIPILLKTPASANDRRHRLRRVISAACPAAAWRPFEERFGVTLWEAYGAVDGAGTTIINPGTAPPGSIGRPARSLRYRLVDAAGRDVATGETGELWVYVGNQPGEAVSYWKNEAATREKVSDGWLRTGDLMKRDARGYLYFVGRNSDSMRRRGENVSAYEVERVADTHPDVLESAAFGVPSPLGEQDIMLSVVPVAGHAIDPRELLGFLRQRLPKYALPAYLDVVDELPKTATHRVIKRALEQRGVSDRTIRLDALAAE